MENFDIFYEQYKIAYGQYWSYCKNGNPVALEWATALGNLCLANKIKLSQDDNLLLRGEQKLSDKTFKKLCKVNKSAYDNLYAEYSSKLKATQEHLYNLASSYLIQMYWYRHTKQISDFIGNEMVFIDACDVGCPNRGHSNNKDCRDKANKLREMGFKVAVYQASYNIDLLHLGTRRACFKGILANVNDTVGLYFATYPDIPFHLWKMADNDKQIKLVQMFYTRPFQSLYLYHFTNPELDTDKPQYYYEKLEE